MSETTKPTFRSHAEEIAWHLDQRDAQADGVKATALVCIECGKPSVDRLCARCYAENKL